MTDLSSENIHHILTSGKHNDTERSNAISSPNAKKEHYDIAMNDKASNVRAAVAKHSPHREHIDKAINDHSRDVPIAALDNPKILRSHAVKLTEHPNPIVRLTARAKLVPHNASNLQLHRALDDDNTKVTKLDALKNKNATIEHYKRGENDSDKEVRTEALKQHKDHDIISGLQKNLTRKNSLKDRAFLSKDPKEKKHYLDLIKLDKETNKEVPKASTMSKSLIIKHLHKKLSESKQIELNSLLDEKSKLEKMFEDVQLKILNTRKETLSNAINERAKYDPYLRAEMASTKSKLDLVENKIKKFYNSLTEEDYL